MRTLAPQIGDAAARHSRRALGCAIALALAGCGRNRDEDGSARPSHGGAAGETVELPAEPDAAAFTALLDHSHLEARRAIGPHRIVCTGTYRVAPEKPPPEPKVGQHESIAVDVRDRAELTWASEDPYEPVFGLQHTVDNAAPRPGDDTSQRFEARAIDGSIYTHRPPRGWSFRPVVSDAHELWLDDVEHCLLGPAVLAAPRLAISGRPKQGGMVYALSRAAAEIDGVRATDPRSSWRAGATIESVKGEVVLGPDGFWRSGTLDVTYRADDVDGRLVRGTIHVEGKREIAPQSVEAPPEATPTPIRERPRVERDELLDGLAG